MMKVKDYHVSLGLKVGKIIDFYIKSCRFLQIGEV